jgi:hypothetical protein
MGWEIMNHPPYSPVLAPLDFHLFGPMKVHLEDQEFQLMMNSNTVSGNQDKTAFCHPAEIPHSLLLWL